MTSPYDAAGPAPILLAAYSSILDAPRLGFKPLA
jgi:hypothetical protein